MKTRDRLRWFASTGMSRAEAAERVGIGVSAVSQHAMRHNIKFVRPGRGARDAKRLEAIVALYQAGYTLENIGQRYGVTRERIRQLLTKYRGIRANDGGAHVRTQRRAAAKKSRRERRCLEKHGCSYEQLSELRAMGRELAEEGVCRERQPIGAFVRQKNNALKRGIPWELTLWQWWTIWQDSGKWEQRGRGHGYCMSRYADSGPYSPENVFITTCAANASDYWTRRRAERRLECAA